MAVLKVRLPDAAEDWVREQLGREQLGRGRFGDVDSYIADLIARDRDTERSRDALVAALIEGEESGTSDQSLGDILHEIRQEMIDQSRG